MILIVAGTRTIDDYEFVESVVVSSRLWKPTEIISGDCPTGPDRFAEAIAHTFGVPYEEYEADWESLPDDSAGPIRNREMARDAHGLVAVWNGHSDGTRSMIEAALDENLDIDVVNTQRHRPSEWW